MLIGICSRYGLRATQFFPVVEFLLFVSYSLSIEGSIRNCRISLSATNFFAGICPSLPNSIPGKGLTFSRVKTLLLDDNVHLYTNKILKLLFSKLILIRYFSKKVIVEIIWNWLFAVNPIHDMLKQNSWYLYISFLNMCWDLKQYKVDFICIALYLISVMRISWNYSSQQSSLGAIILTFLITAKALHATPPQEIKLTSKLTYLFSFFPGRQPVPHRNATSRKHVQSLLRPRSHNADYNGSRPHGSRFASWSRSASRCSTAKDAPLWQIRGMDPCLCPFTITLRYRITVTFCLLDFFSPTPNVEGACDVSFADADQMCFYFARAWCSRYQTKLALIWRYGKRSLVQG